MPNPESDSFTETFYEAVLGAQAIQTAYIGFKLGWYEALRDAGEKGLTAHELATQTKSSERYAREWLEQQTMIKWIVCNTIKKHEGEEEGDQYRFVLPPEKAIVLANQDSLHYLMPLAQMLTGAGKRMDELVEAYRTDTGVSWQTMGTDMRESQSAMNKPFFLQELAMILDRILDSQTVHKLKHDGGRVADIGAGCAWSSVGVAQYFTSSCVDAYDLDQKSIEQAVLNIERHKLGDRVRAYCMNAADAVSDKEFQTYDLVMALECIHDMNDPISVLRTMRSLANGSGTVLVMDEKVGESFDPNQDNPTEALLYGFSCVCCLPDGKSRPASVATGTVMRPRVLRAYAQQAGFKDIEILPSSHQFFEFYRLVG